MSDYGMSPLAREGLQIEPDLGLLPCNVVVRTDEQSGQALVSSLNPRSWSASPVSPSCSRALPTPRPGCRARWTPWLASAPHSLCCCVLSGTPARR